jgi:drug/metabolite transporter (DMT)-like permease
MTTSAPLPHQRSALVGELAILGAAVCWGISTTVSVAALDRVRPPDLVAVELTGAAVLLFVVGAAKGRLTLVGARRNFALGALMPGLAFVLGDLGLSRTSASAGSLLLATDLPLSVLLSMVFLRERLRGWGVVALALGIAGSTVVALGSGSTDGGRSTTVGNLLVIASVAAAAVFLVVTRRYNAGDGLNATAWQTAGGAVCTAPFVLVGWSTGGSRLTSVGLEGWALCLGVLVSTAAAGVAFNWGISRVPGVRASQLLNLTPIAGLVAAVVFLAERPGAGQLAGGALVVLAVVLLVRFAEQPAGTVVEAEADDLATGDWEEVA